MPVAAARSVAPTGVASVTPTLPGATLVTQLLLPSASPDLRPRAGPSPAWLHYWVTELSWAIWGAWYCFESSTRFPMETKVPTTGLWNVAGSDGFMNQLWWGLVSQGAEKAVNWAAA